MAKYTITGSLKNGKRFNPINTDTPQHYNIWKGTLWENICISLEPLKYKRKRIKTYYN